MTDAALQQALAERIAAVEARITAACARAGRARDEVSLIAVSKTHPSPVVAAAYACGLRHFGENRVEEAECKLPELQALVANDPPTWHMIGHVQSRKAKRAAALDWVHSLDSLRLAERLNSAAAEQGKVLPVLVELNVSGESSKEGLPAWHDGQLDALLQTLATLEPLSNLGVRGLMTMAPIVTDPQEARRVFRRLCQVRALLRERLPFSDWAELSMGMTDDYAVAIEEGATMVRIGRAIFGSRDTQGVTT